MRATILVGYSVAALVLGHSTSAAAQEKSCTQVASSARNWLVQNPASKAYSNADVERALKECLRTGYWTNVSKSGGHPAKKQ